MVSFRSLAVLLECVYPRAALLFILTKLLLLAFLLFWMGFGVWLLIKFEGLFGGHPDDPSETPGARSLNLTQVWSCWFGMLAVTLYFLFT